MPDVTIERWLRAQAVGLAAYAVGAFSTCQHDPTNQLRLRARQRLPVLLDEWGGLESNRMIELPGSVLHILGKLDNARIPRSLHDIVQRAARGALEKLSPQQNSPLAKAEILAHQIMNGSGSVTRLTRLAISLERNKWSALTALERNPNFVSFSKTVESLRAWEGGTAQRIDAIAALSSFPGLPYVAQVRNILLHHAFAWPLLVCSGAAISLPVAVDIELDRPVGAGDFVLPENYGAFNLRNEPVIVAGGRGVSWTEHLQQARDVAVLLWAKGHGNCGEFRKNVQRHQARFNFYWASKIAALAFGDDCGVKLPLEGGSAAAYFAQTVLARLLGRRWCLSSAVTGAIGKRVAFCQQPGHPPKNELSYDRDYWFASVDGVGEKYRFVRTTHSFERFVVPFGKEEEIHTARRKMADEVRGDKAGADGDEVQVFYPRKLSGVADVVQVEGWRKTHFIRCPEVAYAIREDWQNKLPEAHQVQQLIAQSSVSVLSLGNRPSVVASAIAEINRRLHKYAEDVIAEKSANADRSKTRVHRGAVGPLAPGLSWCVVRAVEEEQDAGFWRTLWRIIGAPLGDFELFRNSATREVAAERLAEALNHYMPDKSAPSHSAPDVIVIIGLEKFDEGMRKNEAPLARPLAVTPLLDELNTRSLLRPSPARSLEYVRRLAGVARFVIVPECDEDSVPQGQINLSEDERNVMSALATFRFGFSQQMASLLLSEFGIIGSDVRRDLLNLKNRGALREVSGQYFMSHAMRRFLRREIDDSDSTEANRQKAAGIALAPYTTAAPVPGLAYDAAFLPENVNEAEYHFARAYKLYGRTDNQIMQGEIKPWFQRVCRFAAVPHWGAVGRLIKANMGKDAYELAAELMAGWREHGGGGKLPPHPVQYVALIEAMAKWTVEGRSPDTVNQLYLEGLNACSAYPREASFCEILLAATYSVYLYRQFPKMKEEVDEADARVWVLRDRWTNVRGDWFEKNADCILSHQDAVGHYELGICYARQYRQNWIKYLGACMLTNVDFSGRLDELKTDLKEQDKETIEWRRSVMSVYAIKTQGRRGDHVRDRWNAGRLILCECWKPLCPT